MIARSLRPDPPAACVIVRCGAGAPAREIPKARALSSSILKAAGEAPAPHQH
jgi:hypothetical protein